MSSTRDAPWGLSAYPVSAAFRSAIEQRVGPGFEVAVLSELREAGLFATLKRLVRIRGEAAYVLLEDGTSTPILPALQFLASLTRCRQFAVVGPDGAWLPFGRAAGLFGILSLVGGTIRGLVAAVVCGAELLTLDRLKAERRPLKRIGRVAYLKTNLWFGVKAGGSVGHVAGVVNALVCRCERVAVLSAERPPLLKPGASFHPVGFTSAFGYPYEFNYYAYQRRFVRTARRVLADSPPDWLYQRLSLANYAGLRLARDLGVPLILEYNGSEVWVAAHWGRGLRWPWLSRRAEDLSLRHADLIVTVSEVLGQELIDRGVPPERVLVHPNCVDPERFNPDAFSADDRRNLLARHGIAPSAVVCGFIGTFGAWHGVTVLARAIRRLVERDRPWVEERNVHFLIVGDGLLMREVREILSGPPTNGYVTLTGLVEQHEAPAYLAAADILLSPHVPNADGSRFFGSPTKLFEYMAMGKGIVASDLDQIGDVLRPSYRASDLPDAPCAEVDDRLAVVTTPGSEEELVAGIRFLVERPDYRRALGQNARRVVLARYTWDHNVDALLQRLAAKLSLEPPRTRAP